MNARVKAAWAAMAAGLLMALSGLMVGSVAATANPIEVNGNVDSCAQAGYAGALQFYGGTNGGPSGVFDYFTVTITGNMYVTISAVAEGVTFRAVIVKGGDAYHIYNPPVPNMVSPENNGGQTPTISHWFACFDYDPPEPDPELEIDPYCKEVDADGQTIKEWFDIINPNDDEVEVDWADGEKDIDGEGTARVSTAGPGISVEIDGYDGEPWTSDSPSEVCSRKVEFTKEVEGETSDVEYTITVSRLVPPDYVVVETFQISEGETVTLDLPSTGDDSGFTYKIEETDPGTSSTHTVVPGTVTLGGHLGETVSVVITNSYAAIEVDKQVSAATVEPGDELTYTLQAHNTGALDLDDVVISDLLPADVTLSTWAVEDDAGTCSLVQAAQPQVVSCEMDDGLPVGGFSKVVTITVTVDADVAFDTELINQAKVIGFYVEPEEEGSSLDAVRARGQRLQDVEALSCTPVPDGAVCDLSAEVGSMVTGDNSTTTTIEQGSGGGTPTTTTTLAPTTTIVGSNLPTTGSTGGSVAALGMLVFGMGVLTLLLSRRPVGR